MSTATPTEAKPAVLVAVPSCAFGEACSWPVQSFVGKFKDEFVAKGAADEARRAKSGVGSTHDLQIAVSPQSV